MSVVRCVYFAILLSIFCIWGHAQRTLIVPTQYQTINLAISAANNGDTVLVLSGTYQENIDFGIKRLTITTDAANPATIVASNPAMPVVNIPGLVNPTRTRSDTQLCNFVITGGAAFSGAGIYITGCCSILNCQITGNGSSSLTSYGGAAYVSTSVLPGPLFQGCIIHNNRAKIYGAGICSTASKIAILGCTITQNKLGDPSLTPAQVIAGSGICIFHSGHPTSPANPDEIKNCTINGNTAITTGLNTLNSYGGGVYIHNTDAAQLYTNIIALNVAASSGGIGIKNSQNIIIRSSTILGNQAVDFTTGPVVPSGGGIGIYDTTNVLIEKNWIRDNQAARQGIGNGGCGGGIYSYHQSGEICTRQIRIYNNFIYNNVAQTYGGGICIDRITSEILHNSISGNLAASGAVNSGGGVYVKSYMQSNNAAIVNLIGNSIVWGNSGGILGNILLHSQLPNVIGLEVRYCDVEGMQGGWTTNSIASNLVNPPINPLYSNPATGDLHLSSDSPMRGSGSASDGGQQLTYPPNDDFDGVARPLPAQTNPDIGADETT